MNTDRITPGAALCGCGDSITPNLARISSRSARTTDVLDDKMHLSEAGRLAQAVWEGLPTHYPHIRLDAWVVMPNHVHGIVMLTEANADPDPHPVQVSNLPLPQPEPTPITAPRYFITVSTHNRVCLLGDVLDDKMHLSEAGRLAQAVWEGLPTHYPHIRLDAWVVMPNHVHGIVMLTEANADPDPHPVDPDPVRAGFKPAPSATGTDANNARHGLPEIVRAFKTFSARRINAVRGAVGTSVW